MKRLAILLFTSVLFCNQIEKVFFHPGGKSKGPSIDIGQLVFYFPKRQMVNQLSEKIMADGNKTERIYLMPYATIDKFLIDKISAIDVDGLLVRAQEVTKPTIGLQVQLIFDPQKIQIAQHEFDTIGLKKGIVFAFYNKQVLNKLESKQDHLLQTTCDINTVIIDCGHGGSDTGAQSVTGLKEKDLCLSIGKKLADAIKKKD